MHGKGPHVLRVERRAGGVQVRTKVPVVDEQVRCGKAGGAWGADTSRAFGPGTNGPQEKWDPCGLPNVVEVGCVERPDECVPVGTSGCAQVLAF